jgi:hypothetical protein
MKKQRDQLLDILASGVEFKGEITVVFAFDTAKEQPTSTVDADKQPTPVVVPSKPKPKKRAYNAQLKDEQVWDIRDYIKQGYGDAKIRDLMGNTFKASTVWRIRRNKAYARLGNRPHPTTVRAGHGIIPPNSRLPAKRRCTSLIVATSTMSPRWRPRTSLTCLGITWYKLKRWKA